LSNTVCLMLSPPAYLASASAKNEPFIVSPMPCAPATKGRARQGRGRAGAASPYGWVAPRRIRHLLLAGAAARLRCGSPLRPPQTR
jgi:hypothetical protein